MTLYLYSYFLGITYENGHILKIIARMTTLRLFLDKNDKNISKDIVITQGMTQNASKDVVIK